MAFAARCARRVLPAFADWALTRASRTLLLKTVGDTIGYAEAWAASSDPNHRRVPWHAAAHHAARVAVSDGATSASCAAIHAAASAAAAANEADQGGDAIVQVGEAIRAAAHATLCSEAHARAVIVEYEQLCAMAREGIWNDDTPVDAIAFPALVPRRSARPVQRDSDGLNLVVELAVDEGVADGHVLEYVEGLVDWADELHRAAGGRGFRLLEVEILDEARVAEGVVR
ncbi:MAG: hypothetical protein H6834_17725 [Planctomycetes bacterium]|nr:hypothetical protein [Planctomycetota bacterium]